MASIRAPAGLIAAALRQLVRHDDLGARIDGAWAL